MLEHLIESAPRKHRVGGKITSGAVSFAVHTGIVFAAVVGTMPGEPEKERVTFDPDMTFVISAPEEEAPPPERLNHPPPRLPSTITAPMRVPVGIPPVDLSETFDPDDYLSRFDGVESVFDGLDVAPETDPTQIFSVFKVDEAPVRISSPPLEYPRMMQQAGVEGVVVIQAIVDSSGRVEKGSVVVIQTSNPAFDGAAKRLVERSLFQPGRVGNTPVRVLIQIPVHFSLLRGRG